MNTRILSIPGEPVAKARPRVTSKGITYTPAKTKNYETLVRELWAIAYPSTERPLEGPLRLIICAYMQIPKSITKKRRAAMLAGKERPTKRPDLDNIYKSIADSLNGLAYQDDSQIVSVTMEKYWDDTPRVEIMLRELGAE